MDETKLHIAMFSKEREISLECRESKLSIDSIVKIRGDNGWDLKARMVTKSLIDPTKKIREFFYERFPGTSIDSIPESKYYILKYPASTEQFLYQALIAYFF